MLRLSETYNSLNVVADQIGGPTPARDIAGACMLIVQQLQENPAKSGIYHYSGTPNVSWAEFASTVFAQAFLRVFEYGFNKPTREIIYSQLKKDDRYKSSVFIDTFITRFGDLTGSMFMGISKLTAITFSYMPILAIPSAALLTYTGSKIAQNTSNKSKSL